MKNSRMQSIFLIVMSGMFFSLMSIFIRMAGDLPTPEKAFFRNLVAAVVALVLLLKDGQKAGPGRENLPDLFKRSLFGTLCIYCNFYAIDHMNVADANMLLKLSPCFVIIFSYIILKEKADKVSWVAVAVAFSGALFVIKPSFQMTFMNGLVGVMGGMFSGMACTYVHKLGLKGVKGPVIVLFFSAFSTLTTIPLFIMNYVPMTGRQFLFLMLTGAAAAGGQLTMTKAYSKAPGREISVFDYSQIIFAAVFSSFILGQIPDRYSILGYVIIVGAAVFKWNYMRHEDMKKAV